MFEYGEYHIYTTTEHLEKRYVHLTESELSEAQRLHTNDIECENNWKTMHRLEVADNIHLTVGDGARFCPRLESHGYEGWVPVSDGDFETRVFFDDMIFYKCIGESCLEPDWSFVDVKDWVNREHQDKFEREFDEHLAEYYDPDEVSVDW
jgi:hypothetical protein